MLKLQNISKYYSSNDVVALGLRRINLKFEIGEFIAVTGESGSGKSTLLNVISGLDTYEDGEMYVNGEETSYFRVQEWENYRKQYIGFVFQNYNIIDSYTVLDNVLLALTIQGYDPDTRKERALELIDKVGLLSHANHKASKLSGGQKQRAVIARALAKDCPIIVADEPTGNLDSESSRIIMTLLKDISKDKLVIVVTHNFDEVEEFATRKIRLFDGEVIEDIVLKKRVEVAKEFNLINHKMNLLNLMQISLKNLVRTPKRTIFTTIVSMFIVLTFLLGYGAFLESTAGGGNNYNAYFSNVNENRVIVTKYDNEPFTESELTIIGNFNKTRCVVLDDIILDSTIGIFYPNEYNPERFSWRSGYVNSACTLKEVELSEGKLPISKFQVVISDNIGLEVGSLVKMGHGEDNFRFETLEEITETEFEVVGLIKAQNAYDWDGEFYFHEDYFNSSEVFLNAYTGGWDNKGVNFELVEYNAPNNTLLEYLETSGSLFVVDETLGDDEMILGNEFAFDFFQRQGVIVYQEPYVDPAIQVENFLLLNPNYFDDFDVTLLGTSSFYSTETDLKLVGIEDIIGGEFKEYQEYNRVIYVNRNTLEDLFDQESKYQIAVMVKNTFDADVVTKQLSDLGYRTIYPFGIVGRETQIFSIFTYFLLGILLIFFLVIIYFISYLVLRNIQVSKKKDYLVFRSIGANKSDLNKLTIFELVMSAILAYIIVFTLFYFNEGFKSFIPKCYSYYSFGNFMFILFLLIMLAVMLGNRFNKRIFNRSVITALKQE